MMTIEKLMEDTNTALCNHFTKIVNGVKIKPEVYDNTDEIFMDGEEAVSVWCELPGGALKYFNGTVSVIVNADDDIACASVFFGDKCVDPEAAEELASEAYLGSWTVEDIDDYLMIATDFSPTADVEQELTERFAELLSEDFISEIKELLACYK